MEARDYFLIHWWWNGNREVAARSAASSWGSVGDMPSDTYKVTTADCHCGASLMAKIRHFFPVNQRKHGVVRHATPLSGVK